MALFLILNRIKPSSRLNTYIMSLAILSKSTVLSGSLPYKIFKSLAEILYGTHSGSLKLKSQISSPGTPDYLKLGRTSKALLFGKK